MYMYQVHNIREGTGSEQLMGKELCRDERERKNNRAYMMIYLVWCVCAS